MSSIADSFYNLAWQQKQARQFRAALDSYQKALDAGMVRPEEAHLNRSIIYSAHLGEYSEAERELKSALACNPKFTPALLNLANLYEDLGDRTEAELAYANLLDLDPRCFEGLARRANMQPPTEPNPALVARLLNALSDQGASSADRASLGFALGRLLDASGDYSAAFKTIEAANRASRLSAAPRFTAYDRKAQERLVDRLIAISVGTGPSVKPGALASPSQPRPIFICGMFRSGSTLAEQLLANYPGVTDGGEIDFMPRLAGGELAPYPDMLQTLSVERCEALAAEYLAELRRIAPMSAWITDKRPDNFLYIGLIKRLLPDAQIVHTVRNPFDNCLSIYFLHLDQCMSYALDLEDIGHYYREYWRLMTHWKKIFPGQIIDFDYDALVANPDSEIARCSAWFGLEAGSDSRSGYPRDNIAPAAPGRAVRTASVWQVREPLYRRSSGRAANYAAELAVLQPFLRDISV